MKTILELISAYENEVKFHEERMFTWKGKNDIVYNIAESKMNTYERVLDDLKNLPNELKGVSNNELTQEVYSHYNFGICFYKKKCKYQTKDYECTNKLGGNDR